jgi:uncharacterized membrane protein
MSSWHFNPVGSYGLIVAIAAVFLALVVWIGPDVRRMSGRKRTTLVALRVAVFLAVVAGMLRPTHVFTEMKRHRATMIVLVDRSKSMSIADQNGESRWDVLRGAVQDALPDFRGLNDDLDVKFYTFDSAITPVDLSPTFDLGATAEGRETAIGAAMDDALRRETGHRLAGVILLSDGAQNALYPLDESPQTVARRLADLGVPLYTVTCGKESSANSRPDVAVTGLDVSPSVFVKNELAIRGTVRINGYVNKDVAVQALFETAPGQPVEVVGTTTLRSSRDGEEMPVEFSYVPQTAGERKVTLRVLPMPNEQDTTNNEQSNFVKVLPGGLNVFYLEGELRVEQRFLRRALASSPDIKVDFQWIDHRLRKNWPVDLSDRFQPGKYDVYIIGDLDSTAFRPQDLASLRQLVEHGAGLIMLGGFHSFWGGGYQNTPLRDILPLAYTNDDKLDHQDFDAEIVKQLQIVPADPNVGIKMLPDKHFGDVSIMRLGSRDENRSIWQKLPGLDGANRFRGLKPAAKPLAVAPDGQPLLAAVEPGAGRVLAFAGDSTWLWAMAGFEKEHKQFWRQVILWLAKKEDTEKSGVWIKMAQRQYTPGRPIDFSVGALSPQGEPLVDAAFEASAVLPDGNRRPVHLTRQGNQTIGQFKQTELSGDYTLVVTATSAGAAVGEAHARFIVYDQDLELENSTPRPTLMANLAQTTKSAGGRTLVPEDLTKLCRELRRQPRDLEDKVETTQTPWDTPYYFLAVVALLGTEWYLRKKWGLV